jgi:hypothetical protein
MTNGGGHPSDITPETGKPADEKKNPPTKPIGGVK